MRILFTGSGRAGSYEIRARQLARELGATETPRATQVDADVVVVVKRAIPETLAAIGSKPWVYDIVDAWPQPEGCGWGRAEAISWVRGQLAKLKPTAVVWPTQRMMEDCGEGWKGIVLPHHARPGIQINPIRQQIKTVGYEGRELQLGEWHKALSAECEARGFRFAVNEPLANCDVVVAVRGKDWGGYVSKHWKSNVKLANAHASGTPFIGNRECGYLETATGAEYWADSMQEMRMAFDWLESQSTREQISDRFRPATLSADAMAQRLQGFLQSLTS